MNLLHKVEKVTVAVCGLILAATFCLVVVLRYLFQADLFAYEEWILPITFLLYFIGGALASRDDVHIKADIVVEYIRSERTKTIYEGVLLLVEAAIAAVLTYFAVKMVLHEFARWPNLPATPVYKIPLAVPRIFILVGLSLMTLHATRNGIRKFREAAALEKAAAK